jgi:hypothetical protein
MELTTLQGLISKETLEWMRACPNIAEFGALMIQYQWYNAKVYCYECGEKYKRSEMRFDEATPCGNPEALICRNCWDFYDQGTVGDPNYRPPKWPEKLDINDIPKPLIDGHIVDKNGKTIGFCRGYNPKQHFAHKVMLFAYPDDAEAGSLDPECKVIPADNPILFPEGIPKEKLPTNEQVRSQFSDDEEEDFLEDSYDDELSD